MATKRRRPQLKQLEPETWGQRVKRAYLEQRTELGYTYANIAERINESGLATMWTNSMQRLENFEEVPHQATSRLNAYLCLVSYGYDPSDFDLTVENVPLIKTIGVQKVYDLIAPKGPKDDRVRWHKAKKTAGQTTSRQGKPRSRCNEVSAA